MANNMLRPTIVEKNGATKDEDLPAEEKKKGLPKDSPRDAMYGSMRPRRAGH